MIRSVLFAYIPENCSNDDNTVPLPPVAKCVKQLALVVKIVYTHML